MPGHAGDGMDSMGMDYGDVEVQTITATIRNDNSESDFIDGNLKTSAALDFEPLSGVGGLDQNEVAELTYLEVYAKNEFEDVFANQEEPASAEFRGSVGINLPPSPAALIDHGSDPIPNQVDGTFFEKVDAQDGAEENGVIEAFGGSNTDDRYLQHFTAAGSFGFAQGNVQDNIAGGGNGYSSVWHSEKHFRQLTHRGPVLDSQDNITCLLSLNAEGALPQHIGDLKCMLHWDVAETEDSGRRFSVPQ
jgi:hypothetical protein